MKYIPSKDWITLDIKKQMRDKCKEVTFPLTTEDKISIEKMMIYIDESYKGNSSKYNIRAGIGIAANQIGYKKRMFYIRLKDEKNIEKRFFLINPIMLSESARRAYITNGEGCLSVPKDKLGYVVRSAKVKIKGFDYLQQKEIIVEGEGIFGMCLQHEYDHLNGKLYYDRINPINPTYIDPNWIEINGKSKEDILD